MFSVSLAVCLPRCFPRFKLYLAVTKTGRRAGDPKLHTRYNLVTPPAWVILVLFSPHLREHLAASFAPSGPVNVFSHWPVKHVTDICKKCQWKCFPSLASKHFRRILPGCGVGRKRTPMCYNKSGKLQLKCRTDFSCSASTLRLWV